MEDRKLITIFGGIMVAFICGVVLKLAKPVLFPFFLALLFYFILSPALDFLVRRKIPRWLAIATLVLVFFLIFYLLVVIFYSSGKTFASELPKYGQSINSLTEYLQTHVQIGKVNWDPWAFIGNLDVDKIASFLLSSLGSFLSFASNVVIIFIFLVFMLAGRGGLKPKIERSLSKTRALQVNRIIDHIDSQVQKYLAIKTVICLITGAMTTIVLLIFGVDYAVVFGFQAFILTYIPNIGSVISMILPLLVAYLQFGKFWPVFWIFIIRTVLDNLIGNVLEPKLMGKGLGLSPLAVLFSLFFWFWLWGIPGMILSVPILAVLKIVASNIPSLKFAAELISQ